MEPHLIEILKATVSGIIETLFEQPPRVGTPTASWTDEFRTNTTGVVGLAGERIGLVAVHAGRESVRRLAARLTGAAEPTDAEIRDTLCEFANMIAGNLAMHARGHLPPLAVSLPSVIEGTNFYLRFVAGSQRTIVPFFVADAELLVELVIDQPRAKPLRREGA